MDELDRMFRLLVQKIRSADSARLAQPIEVGDIYQRFIPYRHNRTELGVETNQDYELALMRLFSGERGYVKGDEAMQDELKRELASSNPDTTAFRAFASSMVTLSPDAVQTLERARAAPAVTPPPTPRPVTPASAMRSSGPVPVVAAPPPRATPKAEINPATAGHCRYCGGDLPDGRKITFCPHCGQNLTVLHCPACSTELEVGWKFCTTCGRSVSEGS